MHDPIRDHDHCEICAMVMRRTFNRMAEMPLGPPGVIPLITWIRVVAADELDAVLRLGVA